jgi:acetyl-CoA C-acetyltransferase
MSKRRNVAIVGVGQSIHRGHRPDVNQPELVREAVEDALNDSGLDLKDIDCIVHGNMELFEGIHQPDMWHVLGDGAYMKSGWRITTGGYTGSTLACAADNLVASGLYEVVMAVGFEKQEEGQTTTGITAMADPLWGREIQTGAITGSTGLSWVNEFGERAEWAAAKLRVMMAQNARKNPKAHLRLNITEQDVMNSRLLAYPLRLLHMCPESNGTCAVIFASQDKARKFPQKPVWFKDHVTVHKEEVFFQGGPREEFDKYTQDVAADRLYKRNGIKEPLKEFQVFEMYDPSTWWMLDWSTKFLKIDRQTVMDMVEQGEFGIEGSFPLDPSGGVQSTNPIGATALIRVAETALQVRGDAGEHQVPKHVKQAIASGFGGTYWSVLMLLAKEL